MGELSQVSDDSIDLALRLMDDDESALEDVLRLYGPSIAAALRLKYEVFNYEDVEDVLSIAVERLWAARHRYDDRRSKLRTYFWKIADNAACDVFKFGWHRAKVMEVDYGDQNDLDALPDQSDPPNGTSACSESKDNRRSSKTEKRLKDLRGIVDELPEKQRHIIRADAYAKDDVADAGKLADELGIARTSVRVYRQRAMETLRQKIRQRGHEVP